ncbi:fumarylacetoacetate hydrolase family protein [Verrucomicrobia bacterium]|nr:fumarylacetoacetate hydrolase family protein [Verrucomicrobiota bacterium]
MNTVDFQGQQIAPSKIVCIGRNYVDHVKELGNELPDSMVVFMKPNSAISRELKSGGDESHHYEAEICFLCGEGRFVGVSIGIDLTRREIQSKLKAKGLPWERSKAFDGSAVFGSFVALPSTDQPISLTLEIDGRAVQKGDSSLMIYSPDAILEELGSFTTLYDGDIVMTGTPKGVGVIESGRFFRGRLSVGEELLVEKEWEAK